MSSTRASGSTVAGPTSGLWTKSARPATSRCCRRRSEVSARAQRGDARDLETITSTNTADRPHRRRLPGRGRARIGCSGWSYRDCRGRFYPEGLPASQWFASYAEQFDTVELNATFYRLPGESTVERWREQAPPGFCYAVKVGQFGSHRMKLRDPSSWLTKHLDRVCRLGDALGPNLVQLPPRWRRDTARLDEFLSVAPTTIRWAVELRDPSWLHDDVFEVLRRHGAALCIHDLLEDHPWELTTGWAYLRFHGPDAINRRYH
ncbi:MAG TPA: DUF72 domain-containing protein, partial [Ilumatobacteraceae bacterium]